MNKFIRIDSVSRGVITEVIETEETYDELRARIPEATKLFDVSSEKDVKIGYRYDVKNKTLKYGADNSLLSKQASINAHYRKTLTDNAMQYVMAQMDDNKDLQIELKKERQDLKNKYIQDIQSLQEEMK